MDIKNYENLIYEIQNFLDDIEYKSLLKFVNENLKHNFNFKKEKTEGYISISKHNEGDFKAYDWNEDLIGSIEKLIKSIFLNQTVFNSLKIDSLKSINDILIYPKNYFKGSHADNGSDENIKFGCVYYINDDYEGGEIIYPDINISIKPKANTLIIHQSNLIHYTNPIENNSIKKIMTTFLLGEDKKNGS